MRQMSVIALGVFVLAGCSAGNQTEAASDEPTRPAFQRANYDDLANWLCHPDKAEGDACAVDLTATIIREDGTTDIEAFSAAVMPEFDCFYIYPTVSLDTTWNSDLLPGREELNVIANQFARYGSQCRQFAPMYRQRTLLELQTFMVTGVANADTGIRWADVTDSWNAYLTHHNNGRGVLLVGHSQGADMIFQLLREEIIGKPVQDQIIGVHSIGFTAHLDQDGRYHGMPVCAHAHQAGCVIHYASFRAAAEPPATSRFGHMAEDGARAICSDPVRLSGSQEEFLDAYLPAISFGTTRPTDYGAPVETPFVKLPGLLSAECRRNDTHDWLAVTVHAGEGPRADDIPGDVVVGGQVIADWGLHLVDMNIAMGNLVGMAQLQGQQWLAERDSGD